jgi:outer membrane protein TolC
MEAKRRPLHTQLNRLLNREDTISIRIPDSVLLNPPVNGFPVDSLFADNPRLSEWDQLIRSAKASERAAIKSGMPRFGAGLDYIIVGERTDASPPGNGQDAIMPMVSVSLPIFRKKYEAAKKEARLMQSAYSLKKAETANMLAAGYEMAWFEWEKANEMLALYKTQTQQTQQAIDLLLHAYSQSGANFEEILRLQQDLLKYELATAAATTDYLLALAKIDFITAKDLKNEDLR